MYTLTPADQLDPENANVKALTDLITLLNTVLATDGGNMNLQSADMVEGVILIQLAGACGSCAIADLTLRDGVERIIKERLLFVTRVLSTIQTTDEIGTGAWQART